MKRSMILIAIVGLLALVLPGGIAFGQPASATPTTRAQHTFDVANPPSQFDVVQDVLDFAPGAWTPPHVHGGPGFITVIDGEVTFRTPDGTTTLNAGDGLADRPGQVHQAGNVGQAPARTLVTILLPSGGVLTTPQTMANAVTPATRAVIAFDRKFAVAGAPATFDLVEMVLDFAPGAWTPSHTHGGQAFITVLDGQLTARVNGTQRTYHVGDTWTENPGEYFEVGNTTSAPASTAVTFILPKGAPLTILRNGATLPQTGAGGMAPRPPAVAAGLLAVAAGLLAVAGFGARQWQSRRQARRKA